MCTDQNCTSTFHDIGHASQTLGFLVACQRLTIIVMAMQTFWITDVINDLLLPELISQSFFVENAFLMNEVEYKDAKIILKLTENS